MTTVEVTQHQARSAAFQRRSDMIEHTTQIIYLAHRLDIHNTNTNSNSGTKTHINKHTHTSIYFVVEVDQVITWKTPVHIRTQARRLVSMRKTVHNVILHFDTTFVVLINVCLTQRQH